MDSIQNHNSALVQNGNFTAADLDVNKQGKFSPAQIKRFEEERNYIKSTAKKYNNISWLISLIFGMGALFFAAVLYFVGVFDILQESLGGLFFPVLCVAAIFVAILVLFVIPRQYQASVNMYNAMGNSLKEAPLGNIQPIEARAETRKSQAGISRRGHQSAKVSYVLTMDSIEFLITESLFEIIQPKRLYRIYAIKDQGVWILLSMETIE